MTSKIKKLRLALSHIKNFLVITFLFLKNSSKSKKKVKTVIFDLDNNYWNIYLHNFCLFLYLNGYQINFYPNFKVLSIWPTWWIAKWNKNATLSFRRKGKIIITNRNISKALADEQIFELSRDYFNNNKTTDAFIVPMSMYHMNYVKRLDPSKIDDIEVESIRKYRHVFLGNFDKKNYSSETLITKFDMPPRVDTLSHIKNHFPDRSKIINFKDLEKFQGNQLINYLFFVQKDVNDIPSNLPWHQYINFMKEVDFMIAFPGISMPLCHNLVESMSAGVIPIIHENYAKYITPKLKDRVNCLMYKNDNSLNDILNTLNTLDYLKIQIMRKNVLEYYFNNFSPASVINNFEEFINSNHIDPKIILNAEYNSVPLVKDLN